MSDEKVSAVAEATGAQVRWLTPEEQRAWRGFVRLHERLGGRLGRMLQSESNVSPADFAVLVHLTDTPEGRQRYQDLARALEWEKSRMSHHIARMTGRGLVVREECAEDARGAFVVITDAGRAAIEAAAPVMSRRCANCSWTMSPRPNSASWPSSPSASSRGWTRTRPDGTGGPRRAWRWLRSGFAGCVVLRSDVKVRELVDLADCPETLAWVAERRRWVVGAACAASVRSAGVE